MFVFLTVGIAILDNAAKRLGLLDKQFGPALGFNPANPAEYSKAKHNVRGHRLNFHDILDAPDASARRAVWQAWGESEGWIAPSRPERDAVADLCGLVAEQAAKVERLLAVFGRQAKAELRDDAERRDVA